MSSEHVRAPAHTADCQQPAAGAIVASSRAADVADGMPRRVLVQRSAHRVCHSVLPMVPGRCWEWKTPCTPGHLLVCVKNPGFLNVQLLQIACLCSARLTACFSQMLEPPHLLHSTSGPVLAQAGALAFLASIVTRWCSHKLEHLYSLHLSRMCLYSPHLLHLISGPVLAQAGAPAFLASTPYALVLAQAGAPALAWLGVFLIDALSAQSPHLAPSPEAPLFLHVTRLSDACLPRQDKREL